MTHATFARAARISPCVFAALAVTTVLGCFNKPKVDGDKLLCMSDDGCLPGYACSKKPTDLTQAFGTCVKNITRAGDGSVAGAADAEATRAEAAGPIDRPSGTDETPAVDGDIASPDGGAGLDSLEERPTLLDLGDDAASDAIPSVPTDGPFDQPINPITDAPVITNDALPPDIPIAGTGGAATGGSLGAGGGAATGGSLGAGGAGSGGVTGSGGNTSTGGSGNGGSSGTGGATGTFPNLVPSATSIPLGAVATGESSSEGSFTLTNIGQQTSGPLSLSSTSTEFVIRTGAAGDCAAGSTSLGQNASCTVRFVFSPTTPGAKSALITFSTTPGNSGTVSVSGTATQGALLSSGSVSSLAFGTFLAGYSSPSQSFLVTNTGPRSSGAIAVTSNSNEFSVLSGAAGDCTGSTLAPNGTCTVRIGFKPAAAGARSGTVTFSATPGGRGTVAVSGTGQTTCPATTHNGGTGTCIPQYACSAGYHNGGTGNCVVNAPCPTNQLTDDTGTCVNMAGVTWTSQGNQNAWTSLASSWDGTKLAAGSHGGGIYTSIDAGAHWTGHPDPDTHSWVSVASSSDGSRLIAAAAGGSLYASADSGASWSPLTGPWNIGAVVSSADGASLAAVGLENGNVGGTVYTTTDYGAHWTPEPNSPSVVAGSIASSADGSRLVVAGWDMLGSLNSVWTSADSGVGWTSRTPALASNWAWTQAASSADGSRLVVAGNNSVVYTSSDFGATWSEHTSLGKDDWTGIASSADGSKIVAVASSGTMAISTDSGSTWVLFSSPQTGWASVASSADGSRLVAISGYNIYTSSGPVP